jgi:hypothetical protein
MRVLVAGRNASLLAAIARTFTNDLHTATAASVAECMNLLGETEFDLVIACEKLADGSGLQVLSHVAMNSPDTLRIFAARPATLHALKGELGLFGLFRTLPYPIDMRKLSAAIKLGQGCLEGEVPLSIRHVVLQDDAGPDVAEPPAAPAPEPHLAPPAHSTPAPRSAPPAPATRPAPAVSSAPAPNPAPPERIESPPGPPVRDPSQSAAFQRALAKRNATRLEAVNRARRREPGTSEESLAQLARLNTSARRIREPRSGRHSKRTALFVGSGVFVALAVGVLTFALLNANNSVLRTSNARAAPVHQHLVADTSFAPPPRDAAHPFSSPVVDQVAATQPGAATVTAPEETDGPDYGRTHGAADEPEPDHPGPPQPNPPPGPSEPPSEDQD